MKIKASKINIGALVFLIKIYFNLATMKKILLTAALFTMTVVAHAQLAPPTDTVYRTYRGYKLPIHTEYKNFKQITPGDTVFNANHGFIDLTANTLTVDGVTYTITSRGELLTDYINYYQDLTLNGVMPCQLIRYSNFPLLNVVIQRDPFTTLRYYIY